MKLFLRKSADSDGLALSSSYGVAFVGSAIDERGASVRRVISEVATDVHEITYDLENVTVNMDGNQYEIDEFIAFVLNRACDGMLIDSTTLQFPELLFTARAVLQSADTGRVAFTYVEPDRYRQRGRPSVLERRDYELSAELPGFQAIPGATLMMGRGIDRFVFLLGFEERRLDRAFNDNPTVRAATSALLFGVPAFCPGWEMNSFANHVRVIRDNGIRGGIYYCGAENPKRAYQILLDQYDALAEGERLFISPLGTKPMAVAAALFVANHPNVGVLYDHPQGPAGRSEGIGNWHLFEVVK